MDIAIRIGIFFCYMVSRLISLVTTRNPEILERKYYKKYKARIEKLATAQQSKTEDGKLASGNQKLLALGNRFAFRSNLVWGKSKIDEYKAAWFNVLAAEAYREAQSNKQAGGYFHFAAHAFRSVGEYAIAGRYYCESAKQFEQVKDMKNGLRACQRGIACFQQVCDDSDSTYKELVQLKERMANNCVERTQ